MGRGYRYAMSIIFDARNPVELRKTEHRVLKPNFGGSGDFTKEKYERPERSFEEVTAELLRLDAELRARGE